MADTFKGIITADGKKRQLPYSAVFETPVSDETLSIQGAFADAKVVGDNFKKTKAETDSLKEDLRNKVDSQTLVISDNRLKTDSYNAGYSLNQGNGELYAYSEGEKKYVSDYLDISTKTDQSKHLIAYVNKEANWVFARYAFYDKDKKYISGGVNSYDIEIPTNAKYIRVGTNYFYSPSEGKSFVNVNGTEEYNVYENYLTEPVSKRISDLEHYMESNPNKWKGKNVLFYGDSITAINNPDCPDGSWGWYIKQDMDFGNVFGRGIGGQTYRWNTITFYANADGSYNSRDTAHNPPSGTTEHKGCFCSWDRIKTMIPDNIKDSIDLIVLMGGTNDIANVEEATGISVIAYEKPVWSADNQIDSDWKKSTEYNGGDYDVMKFSGAIASTIMKLQTRCPNAIVVICTPLSRWSDKQNTEYNGKSTKDVADVEIEVSKYMAMPHIDVNGTCGINGFNYSTYIADSVHPYLDAGKKMLARTIIGGLKTIEPMIH